MIGVSGRYMSVLMGMFSVIHARKKKKKSVMMTVVMVTDVCNSDRLCVNGGNQAPFSHMKDVFCRPTGGGGGVSSFAKRSFVRSIVRRAASTTWQQPRGLNFRGSQRPVCLQLLFSSFGGKLAIWLLEQHES